MGVLVGLPGVVKQRFFDHSTGAPLVGGKLYTYAAGTTTPLATYTESTGTTPNANPIVLNSNGECDLWITLSRYKFVLKDSNDVTQWTVDNISLPLESSVSSTGTSSAPNVITAVGGVAFVGLVDRNIWYVKSNSGAVTVTKNPQIDPGSFDGQELTLIQTSATDTLQFADGTGLATSGASVIVLDQVNKMVTFIWDNTALMWREKSRS